MPPSVQGGVYIPLPAVFANPKALNTCLVTYNRAPVYREPLKPKCQHYKVLVLGIQGLGLTGSELRGSGSQGGDRA